MMGNNPLTPEQVCFAAKHHRLIYKYLKKRHLPKEEYYDVVVFGYLKAIQDYHSKKDLQQYAFSTICYQYMSREIYNYHRSLQRQLRLSNVVCIHSGQELPIECRVPYGHSEMMKMESRLLFYDLARHISYCMNCLSISQISRWESFGVTVPAKLCGRLHGATI